jgi:hypothetical protein
MITALAAVVATFGSPKAIAAPPGAVDGQEGVQVLTRGPVHEAFAETVTFDPQPGIVAPKSPPAAIEELPPDQKPEGANVAWIPGYWAWDDERTDFLWVSGIWRSLPPGRQWVPGYWGESATGVQWTSGYWADAQTSEIEYLPEPPATAEVGPNIAAPSPDQNWMPGNWVWQQGRYLWRPGSWAAVEPDWDWVPAHYVWTPRGYVYVDGYWDYSVTRRGVLFAPVYFDANVYGQRGFSYSPSVVINPGVFANQLFLRPNYQHYYFGDYYGSNYTTAGFCPWFSYNSSGYGYDPFFAQQRWQHRQDRRWEQNVQADFQNKVDHQNARPPRTWAAQTALVASQANSTQMGFVVAAPLDQLTRSKDSPLRFKPVDQAERQQLGQNGQEVLKLRAERQKLEANAADSSAGNPAGGLQPPKINLPKSPLVSKPIDQLGKNYVPPKALQAPPPDAKVEPKLRVVRSADQPRPYTVNRPVPDMDAPKTEVPQNGERKAPQAQPQSKVEPKATLSVPQRRVDLEPKPVPKVEPKLAPTVDPNPVPKVEPKLAPKVETRPAPVNAKALQVQPQPKIQQGPPAAAGKPAAPLTGPAGQPPAGPPQDKPTDKGKN